MKAIYLLPLSGHAKARPYVRLPLQLCNNFTGIYDILIKLGTLV